MVSGIVNVYKEKGFTSFDVVAKMRGIFHQKKVGHTGTLDPDAEGVLPICLGKATRVCDLLTDKDKVYEAVMLLGKSTDTQDVSGEIIEKSVVVPTNEEIEKAIHSFVGKQKQIPPMYSALKVNGQKLCDLARQGITVERKERDITIFSIEIMEICFPRVRMKVHCSKGTYIRTLCNDIGKSLGCFGCMESLLRTKVADYTIENALRLSEIEELVKNNPVEAWNFVGSVDSVFMHFSKVETLDKAKKLVENGNRIPLSFIKDQREIMEEKVRLYDADERFIGIYTYISDTMEYKPIKIFAE